MKEAFKAIQILHLALSAGCLLIGLFLVFLVGQRAEPSTLTTSFLMLISFMTAAAVVGGHVLYNNRIKNAGSIEGLQAKLEDYRSNALVRWALAEGTALMAAVFMFLEGSYVYLIFFAIAILALVMARPTAEVFIKDYNLKSEEESNFRSAIR